MKNIFLLALFAVVPIYINAQETNYPSSFEEPIPLFDVALGEFEYPISSESEKAQAYFNEVNYEKKENSFGEKHGHGDRI